MKSPSAQEIIKENHFALQKSFETERQISLERTIFSKPKRLKIFKMDLKNRVEHMATFSSKPVKYRKRDPGTIENLGHFSRRGKFLNNAWTDFNDLNCFKLQITRRTGLYYRQFINAYD